MKKTKTVKITRADILQQMIDANYEDIIRMEIVRDYKSQDTADAKAKLEIDAANDRIKKAKAQIEWMEAQLNLES